jgi:hypothetical protein
VSDIKFRDGWLFNSVRQLPSDSGYSASDIGSSLININFQLKLNAHDRQILLGLGLDVPDATDGRYSVFNFFVT